MVDNRKFSVRTVLKKIFPSIIILLSVFTVEAKIIGKISIDYFKRPLLRIDAQQIYIVDQALKKGFIYKKNNLEKKLNSVVLGRAQENFRPLQISPSMIKTYMCQLNGRYPSSQRMANTLKILEVFQVATNIH